MPTVRNRHPRASDLARKAVFRPRDVAAGGLSRTALGRLVEAGRFERVGRGLYAPANAKVTEHHTLVEAAARVPHGIVCLLSALRFHGLTTQNPHEVWIAIDVKARKPAVDWPPLHVVRFSGELSRTASTRSGSRASRSASRRARRPSRTASSTETKSASMSRSKPSGSICGESGARLTTWCALPRYAAWRRSSGRISKGIA